MGPAQEVYTLDGMTVEVEYELSPQSRYRWKRAIEIMARLAERRAELERNRPTANL